MADIPSERLAFQCPPFTNVGLDYFGPFHVTIRRSSEKRWGFLLTCLTTRAIHVEIAHSVDTNSCVMGIERFIARRGMPLVICFDNGTNFVGTEKELLLCFLNLDKQKIASELAQEGVKWKFNPPAAPHHGGVWGKARAEFQANILRNPWQSSAYRQNTPHSFLSGGTATKQPPIDFRKFRCQRFSCINAKPFSFGESQYLPSFTHPCR
ncbi:uncharacterized protein LOC142345935 [Convolutriloba macropyga]|uniref:uncharacterized protein LOC142345935 n=1 Tax=Convolutriloba macropyga TaxID=536237 RepID=UPI003F51E433